MSASEKAIHIKNAYEKDSVTYYPVLVVGAGAAGIAMGCQLREKLGFDQFRIFDRQAGIGGTWWINRYPGVSVDIPSVFYSFSFMPCYDGRTAFPPGPEIIDYLHLVCRKYQIIDKIQLNTDVSELRWLEDEQLWEATLVHMVDGAGDLSAAGREERLAKYGKQSVCIRRETVRAKIVVSAVGGLVEPNCWPKHVPGRETFEGDVFHSARWNYDVDLNQKDIIVVGTGCSAAQFVPLLTKPPYNAKSVTQIMRSPPWVIPRPVLPAGSEEWFPFLLPRLPGLGRAFRTFIFLSSEFDYFRHFQTKPRNQEARKQTGDTLLRYMKTVVPKKYHEMLTPDYELGCKRRIYDDDWFAGMSDPKFNLTTQPLTSIQPKGITLGPGRCYPDMKKTDSQVSTDEQHLPADTIILANGFDLRTWLHPLKVQGRGGQLLHDVWESRGGPQAYLGTAMDGFPNFFIIFGPNTATGHSSVILAAENMVQYSLKFIKPIINGDVRTVEVKKDAEVAWTKDIQEGLKDMVWAKGGCFSWYSRDDGWNSTAYPRSQIDFGLRCMFPKWKDWDIAYTAQGLRRRRLRQSLWYVLLAVALLGAYQVRVSDGGLKSLAANAVQPIRFGILKVIGILHLGLARLESKISVN